MTQSQKMGQKGSADSSATLRGSIHEFQKIAEKAGFERDHGRIPTDRWVLFGTIGYVQMSRSLRETPQGCTGGADNSRLWIYGQKILNGNEEHSSIRAMLSMTSPRASFDGRHIIMAFPMKSQAITEGQTWEGGHKDPDRYRAALKIPLREGTEESLDRVDIEEILKRASKLEAALHSMLNSDDIRMLECKAFNDDLNALFARRPIAARDGFISGWMREVKIALAEFNDAPARIISKLAADPSIRKAIDFIADKEETAGLVVEK